MVVLFTHLRALFIARLLRAYDYKRGLPLVNTRLFRPYSYRLQAFIATQKMGRINFPNKKRLVPRGVFLLKPTVQTEKPTEKIDRKS